MSEWFALSNAVCNVAQSGVRTTVHRSRLGFSRSTTIVVMYTWADLAAENERLARETEALEREHAEIQSHPFDLNEHEAHRVKLRAHINALHAHIQGWQRRDHSSRRF